MVEQRFGRNTDQKIGPEHDSHYRQQFEEEAALVKKQPEADGESNRWRYKKNRQFRLLSKEMLQFESDLEELLDRAFSLENLTLDKIIRAANHLAAQHEVERKNPNDQVIPYGQKLYKILVK